MVAERPLTSGSSEGLSIRLIFLAFLLAAEALVISVTFDAQAIFQHGRDGDYSWLGNTGYLLKILVAWVVAFLIALGPRLRQNTDELLVAAGTHRYLVNLAANLSVYAAFFLTTDAVFSDTDAATSSSLLSALWLLLAIAVAASWLLTVAPGRYWISLARNEILTLLFAGVVAILVWSSSLLTIGLWDPLSGITFHSTAALLEVFYPAVIVDSAERVLGVGDFVVRVAAVCSGYEGIGLVVIFTGYYLSIFRQDFRFPHVLLLFPVGIVVIWLFNVIRIAVLVIIGAELSPTLALGGFHSLSGWISFILVAVGVLIAAHSSPLLAVRHSGSLMRPVVTYRMALLLPLVMLLATTIATLAMTEIVDWWYPARVILTGGTILLLWRHFRHFNFRPTLLSISAGVLTFIVWLLLIRDDPELSAKFASQLDEVSGAALVSWLLFRFIGAVLTVPLAEELAFRGYLFATLGADEGREHRRFPWLALAISSILFGLLHSAWIAGFMAGLVYGLVRWRSDSVAQAFIAHATTNLLLTVYVLSTGSWSVW